MGGGGNDRGTAPLSSFFIPPQTLPPPPPALGEKPLRLMVEAEGIGEGGRATAGEDMDGAMADCGGRGTGEGAAAEGRSGGGGLDTR
jgi:hypothetical protein